MQEHLVLCSRSHFGIEIIANVSNKQTSCTNRMSCAHIARKHTRMNTHLILNVHILVTLPFKRQTL